MSQKNLVIQSSFVIKYYLTENLRLLRQNRLHFPVQTMRVAAFSILDCDCTVDTTHSKAELKKFGSRHR